MTREILVTGLATAFGVLLAQVLSSGTFRFRFTLVAILAGLIAVLLVASAGAAFRRLKAYRRGG